MWDLAELYGFLEARFGSIEQSYAYLSGGAAAIGFEAFSNGLKAAGFAEGLPGLWAALDMDGNGFVSAADFVKRFENFELEGCTK